MSLMRPRVVWPAKLSAAAGAAGGQSGSGGVRRGSAHDATSSRQASVDSGHGQASLSGQTATGASAATLHRGDLTVPPARSPARALTGPGAPPSRSASPAQRSSGSADSRPGPPGSDAPASSGLRSRQGGDRPAGRAAATSARTSGTEQQSSWATAGAPEDDEAEAPPAARGHAGHARGGDAEAPHDSRSGRERAASGEASGASAGAAAGLAANDQADAEEFEDDADMPSVDSVPLPDSLDRPTARLIQQMIWDEGAKIPPDIPDDQLPTFGEIRSRVEARMTTKIRKPWRKWMRETTTILLQRQAAGLPIR
mmetsp:Transcript_3533/g.14682  ORF Transcript_3533/g.14682 Transcript_3533/m.14682 type:complete len:312 (-) Transcript_3533:91-1026(-)